jgi:thymidylate kinase
VGMTRKTSENLRPRFVSFSGIDGAGKSTQIAALSSRLNEVGVRVVEVTFWTDVARLTRIREVTGHTLFKGDKGVGTPTRPVNRRDKNVRSWFLTAVRFGLYLFDAFSLRILVARMLRADADVVIFDRYLYDELANLSLRNGITRLYVRLLLKLVPQPDICYLLDADPILARARKPEYPLDFLFGNRASYLDLSELVGGMTIIPPQPVQDVERQVLQVALAKLSPDCTQSFPTSSRTARSASK